MERKPPPTSPADRPAQDDSRADKPPARGGDVLQLFAEEAKVSRQTVETGRVRISTVTHTRDHVIDELLARTNVEVERVPVGRMIDAIPPVKNEADLMIIPIVEETVVVERRLLLKEELHVRRLQTTERFRETVQLRHQTAKVTRIPAQKPAASTEAAVGPGTQRKPEDT
jgi:uncharacterized protein (TIGR02271 family)